MYEEKAGWRGANLGGRPAHRGRRGLTDRAYLVTFDPINVAGVRWPDFKLKVRA